MDNKEITQAHDAIQDGLTAESLIKSGAFARVVERVKQRIDLEMDRIDVDKNPEQSLGLIREKQVLIKLAKEVDHMMASGESAKEYLEELQEIENDPKTEREFSRD